MLASVVVASSLLLVGPAQTGAAEPAPKTPDAAEATPATPDAAPSSEGEAPAEGDDGYVSPFAEEDAEAEKPEPALPTAAPARGYETPPASMKTLGYADHLFLDGDWYRSITEYRRFLYDVKGRGEHAPRAAMAVGEALIRGEQYDAAGRQLDGVAKRTSSFELRRTALFGAGRAYLLDGRPELAKPRFRLLAEDVAAPLFLKEEAVWLLAWGHFEAGELEVALMLFQQIAAAGGRHALDAQGVVAQLQKKDGLSTKNPFLAGALSLIPGLGHIYLGQMGVGLTSFAWNILFIVAAGLAWAQGQWGPAIILTVFELGWFSGGIFGAVAGAYKHNRDVIRNWRDEIIADYGVNRDMPDMYVFEGRNDASPGSLVRFGGAF